MGIVPVRGNGLDRSGERPRRWFGQPYPWREAVRWVGNNLWGPSRRYAGLTRWLPPESTLGAVRRELVIAFAGDILPVGERRCRAAPALRALLHGADLLVANFEGTLAGSRVPRVFMAQAHGPGILEFLSDLFPPERTLLNVANNHAGDFDRDTFERSCERLEGAGFHVFGRADRPGVRVDDVLVAGYTEWSNQPCGAICREEPRLEGEAAQLRVLTPHWGYELQAYPHPRQIARARDLARRWDLVVGHHSHWPQPVTAYAEGGRMRPVAYSLGNFTFGLPFARHLHGLLLIVEVGPRQGGGGTWGVGRITRWGTRTVLLGRREAMVVVDAGVGCQVPGAGSLG
jgi:hypothetical protein